MVFFNPSFDPYTMWEKPARHPLRFHRKLPGYRPTPLHSLQSFADRVGVERVFLKDECFRLGLPAFKILGASWGTYCALCERFPGLRKEWSTFADLAGRLRVCNAPALYAATDGNHGRAVARVARLFGLRARISVPEGTVTARITAIQEEGASASVVDGSYDDAVAKAYHDAEEAAGLLIQDNSWEEYQSIPRDIVAGYSTMLHEIDEALSSRNEPAPTHVFVQIGNGSFADAVVRHYRTESSATEVLGVEPDGAACALASVQAGTIVRVRGPHPSIMAGMNCDSPSLISFPVMQKGIRCFISIPDGRTKEAMRLLARLDIVSGETGAAGMGTLLEILAEENATAREELGIRADSRILIFSTEGATDPELYRKIVQG